MENKEKDLLTDLKSGVQNIGKQVGKFLGDTFQGDGGDVSIRTDIYTTDSQYVIEMELPGMEKTQVSIQMKDDTLIVKGNKPANEGQKSVNYLSKGRKFGEINRHFELPATVQNDGIKAKFEHGLLVIRFPLLKPQAQPEGDDKINIE